MVSASAKARHTISRRLGVCKARAEPLNRLHRLRGSFCAAFLSVCVDNVSVTFYFYNRFSSACADNVSVTFYFYAMFYSVYVSNESMTLVVLIFLLKNLA